MCFKIDNLAFEKLALSRHIMTDHPAYFSDKYSSFNFGIDKRVTSGHLDRAEDFFIFNCQSDIVSFS